MKNISLRAGRFLTLALLLAGLGLGSCKKDDTTTVYGNWTQNGVGSYSGAARSEAVSFVINSVAYAGTGRNPAALSTNNVYGDFYAFNPSKGGGWSPVTPMPAAAGVRYGAAAFTVNNKGYVCGGYGYVGTSTASNYLSDVWEFDPATPTGATIGTWKQVKALPTPLFGAVAGNIGNTGLVGCGFDGTSNTNIFYQFDGTNWSTQTNTYPGNKRTGAMSFVVNNQFYVVGGTNNNIAATDVYAYSPANGGAWTPKHYLRNISNSTESYDYSGVSRSLGVGFAVNDKGYVAVGGSTLNSCYEYNPLDDTWTLKNPFNASARNGAVGFGIGNYGYVGLGYSGTTRYDDFYRFAPNDAQE